MNRRRLLFAFAATLVASATPASATSVEHVEYSREAFERALASGEPFMLDFFAPW